MKYDDIINLPHHVSTKRPQMPMSDRAAQFSPFVALTGYDSAIKEMARLTSRKIELDEDAKAILDMKQAYLMEIIEEHPEVMITHFVPDKLKDGGRYVKVTKSIKRIDEHNRLIYLTDNSSISMDNIIDIESDMLPEIGLMNNS